jgi:hypothetical protein
MASYTAVEREHYKHPALKKKRQPSIQKRKKLEAHGERKRFKAILK